MEHRHESPLQIEVSADGVVVTVTVTGELDIATVPGLMERLLKVADAHPERLVLDLGGLVFIDVAGARALDETYKLLQVVCPVILRQPRPSARKVFTIIGVMGDLSGPLASPDLQAEEAASARGLWGNPGPAATRAPQERAEVCPAIPPSPSSRNPRAVSLLLARVMRRVVPH